MAASFFKEHVLVWGRPFGHSPSALLSDSADSHARRKVMVLEEENAKLTLQAESDIRATARLRFEFIAGRTSYRY